MADKITKDDIFEGDIFASVTKDAKEFEAELMRIVKTAKDVSHGLNDALKGKRDKLISVNADDAAKLKVINAEIDKSIKLQKLAADAKVQQLKIEQQVITTIAKERQETEKAAQAQSKLQNQTKKEAQQAAKETANQAKAAAQAQSAYYQLSKQLNENKKKVKDLLASNKELTDHDKELIHSTQELDKKLKEIDSTVGDNQRNVGGYKEALKDISAELGAFGGGLSRVVRTLKLLQEENEQTTSSSKKLGNALKIIGAGLLLAAVALAAKAFESAKEGVLKLANALEVFNAQTEAALIAVSQLNNVFEATAAAEVYIKQIQQSRIELRLLEFQLQKITFALDEQNQIASDSTIGFQERNKALFESIDLSVKKAEKSKEIAALELSDANAAIKAAEVAAGIGQANNELKDKQFEAQKKFNEANATADLLTIQNAEKIRQFNSERTIEEINLLLRKKESANADKHRLEEELKDQKFQLEERRKINTELLQVNLKTTNEELRIFKQGFKVKFDSNELLKEQDAVLLANRLKNLKTAEGHGLGKEAISELARIVKAAQEAQIANEIEIKKLQEEEIKRLETIANIESEIALTKQKDLVSDLQKAHEVLQSAQDETLQKTLEGGHAFDSKLEKRRKFQIDIVKKQSEEILAEQTKLLEETAQLEKEKIDQSVNDKKIAAQQKKKIDEQLFIDLGNLQADADGKDRDNAKKNLEDDKKIHKARLDIIREETETTISTIEKGLDRQNQVKEAAIEHDLAIHERAAAQQQSLAERGLKNQLAFEEAAIAKDQLAKEEQKKLEVRQQKTLAFLRLFASFAERDPDTALSKALVETAIATAITGSFKDGVEGLDGAGTETSDSILARLSKGESVVTAKATKENSGLPTALNEGRVDEYFEQKYLPKYIMNGNLESTSTAQNFHNSALLHQMVGVNNRLKSLEQTLANKKEQSVHLDNLGNVIVSHIEKGFTQTTKYKTRKPVI